LCGGKAYMSYAKSSAIHALLSVLSLCLMVFAPACGDDGDDGLDGAELLEVGGPVGKEDNAGVGALPVNGNYADTTVWQVLNQWEDTDTPAAREAGLAWGPDSGLNWDEKFSAWVESLEQVDGDTVPTTFRLTTPWGKSLPAPKLDCANVALTLRASFAAWYNLPFYMVAFDGGQAVYFGHFGMRTSSGIWNNMPKFATAYQDFTHLSPAEYGANWPTDSLLRARGTQPGDDQPFLEPGARTGAYLDEIHLNKRAGHFIRLLLIFTGSMHLADSRNTYNLTPASIRPGDVLLWRWQAQGVGHTMLTVRVDELGDGRLEAQNVFGNLPPNQPRWTDAVESKRQFTDERGGGHNGTTDFAPLNGGLKRFRVTKNIGGIWTNTWMAGDEASWVNDTDHERMRRRPKEFEDLLGQVSPDQLRDALLNVIAQRRAHLRDFPASCAARAAREQAFTELYSLMEREFGMTAADVDAEFRTFEDYVFAELVYEQSKTCCWNSTNNMMYETVMSLNEELQQEAGEACVQPLVFKARDGDYEVFRQHQSLGWAPWSEDEACPQRNVLEDQEVDGSWTPFCEWNDGVDEGDAPAGASCVGRCGSNSTDGSCFCDDECSSFGDCCSDFAQVCA
jgi:hypothetical protein